MVIIIGLGNKGSRYGDTYHNLGFMVADRLASILSLTFSKEKCKSLLAEGNYKGEKVILAKPQTYMNNSGEAAVLLKQKFKDARIIVAVDDIDLPAGKVRYRQNGSAGTHNGLRSIVEYIGQDFERVKVGTGRADNMDLADFVLSKIADKKLFAGAVEEACNMILEKIC